VERLWTLGRRAWRDHLIRNSVYLTLTMAAMALGGFVSWLVIAHLMDVNVVGRATSLVAALTMLSSLSALGLNGTIMRYLPTSSSRNRDVGTSLTVVTVAGLLIGLGYALLLPLIAPSLSFVTRSPWQLAAFAVYNAAMTVNMVTDAVYIALRATRYKLVLNGILMSTLRIGFPVLLAGAGTFGAVTTMGLSALITAVLSVLLMRSALGLRPRLSPDLSVLRRTFRYSSASYVTSSLAMIPMLVIPPAILNVLGPAVLAGFYVSLQVANLLNSICYMVADVMLAEGSQAGARLRRVALRAAALIVLFTGPPTLVVVLAHRPILLAFGAEYADRAGPTLVALAISALAVAFNAWSGILINVTRQLWAMVGSNVVFASVTVGLTLVWVGRGTVWVALAWALGNLASGAIAIAAFLRRRQARRGQAAASAPGQDPPGIPAETSPRTGTGPPGRGRSLPPGATGLASP
jgi:O-antigen/teichoic acid export membrane protein